MNQAYNTELFSDNQKISPLCLGLMPPAGNLKEYTYKTAIK